MQNESLPPSGPWSGYYIEGHPESRHQMSMSLKFDGTNMDGDGIDEIGPFVIHGVFGTRGEVSWTKSYIGKHSVQYQGQYNGRGICGDWTIGSCTGGFMIWPYGLGDGVSDAVEEVVALPVLAHN